MNRVILHCDLNSFYASVECLYNPDIRDKPVAVCGSQSTRHGIILAKNNVAKKCGVKTGEAVWEAREKCHDLVLVRPNYHLYLRFSLAARRIYETYTDLVESFGIDECWLDVTESTKLFGSGYEIADKIRNRIKEEIGITVSIGVSYNKIYAKLGSDYKKPDAITVISENNYKDIVFGLPAGDLLYVGHSTGEKLNRVGILTIGDLANAPKSFLHKQFGKWGDMLWVFANGYDMTEVARNDFESSIKSIGNSITTARDLTDSDEVKNVLYILADSVGERLRRHNLQGRTVQIWIRDSSLASISRQAKLACNTYITPEIAERGYSIFLDNWNWTANIRAVGLKVSDLVTADTYTQLSFFDDSRRQKRELLDKSIDSIRERFGHYSVQRALLLKDKTLSANPAEENTIHPIGYFR